MSQANDYQVGGDHYKASGKTEHWDFVWQHDLDYFQGQITKYVTRWKKKGGLRDLEKAKHFLEKYIELVRSSSIGAAMEQAKSQAQAVQADAKPTQEYPRAGLSMRVPFPRD